MHLVGFIIRNLSRCTVTWTSKMYLNLRHCILVCFWMCPIKCFRFLFVYFPNTNSRWNLGVLTRVRQTSCHIRYRSKFRIHKTIEIPKLTSLCCLATRLTQASGLCGATTMHCTKELSAVQLPVLSAPTSLCLSLSPSPNFTLSSFISFWSNSRPQSVQPFYLTLRLLMSYIYGAPILNVSRSHTTTQHSR